MTTTIQITEDVKSKLFDLINRLEKKWGRRVTYNEALRYLLDVNNPIRDKITLLEHIDRFAGFLLPGEGKSALSQMRWIESERDKRLRSH